MGALICAPALLKAQGSSACLPSDTLTVSRLQDLVELLTATDSVHRMLRDSLGLAQTSAANVRLETKKQICTRARQAIDSAAVALGHVPPNNRRVYLYQLGNAWGIEDPTTPDMTAGDEYRSRIFFFFASNWAYLSSVLYPPYRF
jgi:hypothetical protein